MNTHRQRLESILGSDHPGTLDAWRDGADGRTYVDCLRCGFVYAGGADGAIAAINSLGKTQFWLVESPRGDWEAIVKVGGDDKRPG